MWRVVRIAVLLTILAFVALGAYVDRERTTDWDDTLWVGVFPVNGDGRASTGRYIAALTPVDFAGIEAFFSREAESYGVQVDRPVHVELYPEIRKLPPRLEAGASLPGRVWWSLKTRLYSSRHAGETLADIRVFVLFHDPEQTFSVPHSLGLQKGLVGIVYAYADSIYDETNNFVIAHEVMHTLGATDKYDPETSLPLFPHGYADPDADPLYPQDLAEIMAGRIPLSASVAEMPRSLSEAVVGPATAAEVNWIAR